jgi:hypothetical protein
MGKAQNDKIYTLQTPSKSVRLAGGCGFVLKEKYCWLVLMTGLF